MAESANLGSYSPEDVVILITHPKISHTISGLADGTFVSYARTVPRSTLTVGADLHAARTMRRNKAGTVTLTLMQTAESNDILSMLAAKDEEAHNNSWIFSLTIKDLQGRSLFYAPQAFIGNDPDASYGTELGNREWTIEVIGVQRHFGGNSILSPENVDALTTLGYTVDPQWNVN